jgi:hypothetical protein
MLARLTASLAGPKKPAQDLSVVPARILKIEPPLHLDHPRENDHIPTELKRATYREAPRRLTVDYAIFHGNRCVFSTVIGRSSINMGEDIAQVIARREARPLNSLRFYDLQTVTGYGTGLGGYQEGDFEFDEIILIREHGHIYIDSWKRTSCPSYVSGLFRHLIGGEPKKRYAKDADKSSNLISNKERIANVGKDSESHAESAESG